MKTFFNIDLLDVESRTILKKIFMITFFDHCNVLSCCTTYALEFFHCISNAIENKNSKLPHIYQNSNISSNFHPPSLLHHSFTSFNFLMMVCNMRQQLQILLFSLLRLGCIERNLEKSGYFYFLFFSHFWPIETQQITSFL
jgi:hypothetical protein